MKRASYRQAIEYIAFNDEPTISNADDMSGFPSVQLVGYVFDVPVERVTQDIIKLRERELDTGQAR